MYILLSGLLLSLIWFFMFDLLTADYMIYLVCVCLLWNFIQKRIRLIIAPSHFLHNKWNKRSLVRYPTLRKLLIICLNIYLRWSTIINSYYGYVSLFPSSFEKISRNGKIITFFNVFLIASVNSTRITNILIVMFLINDALLSFSPFRFI